MQQPHVIQQRLDFLEPIQMLLRGVIVLGALAGQLHLVVRHLHELLEVLGVAPLVALRFDLPSLEFPLGFIGLLADAGLLRDLRLARALVVAEQLPLDGAELPLVDADGGPIPLLAGELSQLLLRSGAEPLLHPLAGAEDGGLRRVVPGRDLPLGEVLDPPQLEEQPLFGVGRLDGGFFLERFFEDLDGFADAIPGVLKFVGAVHGGDSGG